MIHQEITSILPQKSQVPTMQDRKYHRFFVPLARHFHGPTCIRLLCRFNFSALNLGEPKSSQTKEEMAVDSFVEINKIQMLSI